MTKPLPFTQAGRKCHVDAAQGQPVVYFVRIGDHIKIGFSTNLDARLKSFATASADIELLLIIPGDRALERSLHDLLDEARIAREIFRQHRRIANFIDNVEYGGLDRGLQWLEETTPTKRREQKIAYHKDRMRVARQSKAEQDAYYASLVAQRKLEIGR